MFRALKGLLALNAIVTRLVCNDLDDRVKHIEVEFLWHQSEK